MELDDMTYAAFVLCNTLRTLAYVPQLWAAARVAHGCAGISCLTWSLFLIANVAAVAYAAINVGDPSMALIFAVNAFFCLAILGLVATKRLRHARREASVKWSTRQPAFALR